MVGATFTHLILTHPQSSLMRKLEDVKDDGKDKRRETTGRSCFQDGGRRNGGFEIKIKAIERERYLVPYDTTNCSFVIHLTFRTLFFSLAFLSFMIFLLEMSGNESTLNLLFWFIHKTICWCC